MIEGAATEILKRKLIPLSEIYGADTCGIPNDSPLDFQKIPKGQELTKESFLPNEPKTLLKEIYSSQPILMGKNADNSRFVFNLNVLINSGGTAKIHPATDRINGKRGVAKVVNFDYANEDNLFQLNEQIQLEGELMAILQGDPFLKEHIVEVWDIALARIKGKESIIIFEERMEEGDSPTIESSRFLNAINQHSFLKVADQLCQIVDRLAGYNIFHHDFSPKNIFINLKSMNIKIGDLGTSNFALDVDKYGVSAQTRWVSPERENYCIGDEISGLVSEIFTLTAIIYYFLTGGYAPYDGTVWPSERDVFNNKTGKIKTFFDLEMRGFLMENCKIFSQNQLKRLIKVFEKGLAVDPNERYQSGKQLMDAIKNSIYPPEKIISFVRSHLK